VTAPARRCPVRVGVVDDDEISDVDRMYLASLFPTRWRRFENAEAARGAFTQQQPRWRVVGRAGVPLSQAGLVLLADGVIGISDLVVASDWRRRGIATVLCETAAAWCDAIGSACAVDTEAEGLRRRFTELGFVPAAHTGLHVDGASADNVLVRGLVHPVSVASF
jgi:GNAT superfamily N-acetyltransferase